MVVAVVVCCDGGSSVGVIVVVALGSDVGSIDEEMELVDETQ